MNPTAEVSDAKLIIVAGPTAVGKTAYAVRLAEQLGTEIVSCDSRQFYSEMNIGVARPSQEQLAAVHHHFIACRSVREPYNIYDYGEDAERVIVRLLSERGVAVACGGSGLYIDALLRRPARLPDPPADLRAALQAMPIDEKRARLKLLDPDSYAAIDLRNPLRLQRALEICLVSGRPYSLVLAEQEDAPRPYRVEMHVLCADAAVLRERIDRRVDEMIEDGLVDEVRSLSSLRHLSTLRTVGYRELFPVIDGEESLSNAVAQIKLNTWHYARKQLTWLHKYKEAKKVSL